MRPARSALIALALTALPAMGRAQTQSFSIPGTSNIYASGSALIPAMPGGGGTLPGSYLLPAGTGRTLVFDAVTGSFGCCGAGSASASADGYVGNTTDITPYNGLSGIQANSQAFLAAVFLAGAPLGSTPPMTLFPSLAFATYTPLLDQVFFVGDGLTGTGTGTQQIFYIPDGATTLYLGYADAYAHVGAPSYYDDNVGTISGRFTVNAVVATPEPGSLVLLATGLAGVFARRKKRETV